MSRSRGWVFTINNYTDEDVKGLAMVGYQYLVYGKEVGEQGTPHLQGYVYFKNPIALKSLSKKIPRASLQVRRGTHDQAREYCIKDGDVFEDGVPPQQNGGDKLATRIDRNKRLREDSYDTLLDSGDISFLELEKLKRCRLVYEQEGPAYSAEGTRGIWVHGKPGTGKTHFARNFDPGYFTKAQNKWFDGYTGQKTIVLDDLDKFGICLGHYLKIWADKWPCTGEVKGGTINLKHETFIVTSNYTPDDLWPDDEEMRLAIKRRFQMKKLLIKSFD